MWWQILYYVVTLALSIALAPKPPKPKAAALEDFEFPTAEEGRPIPVIFGEVDITGPNVLWYGNLRVQPIKKRSGFSKSTVGYKYFIAFHVGMCHGPIDALTRIAWGDKEVWTGSLTANGSAVIEKPGIFGGEKRGGGINGGFDLMMGGDTQGPNAYLATALAQTPPSFRGIVGWLWKGGYIGTSEYVRPVAFRVRRVLQGWELGTWYPEKALIESRLMNPVHVIYQCLTDTRWGMGADPTRINDTNFRAMADLLYAENFGVSMNWAQTTTIEQFLQIVIDHIGGGLSLQFDSGQFELAVFRDNYDPDTLDSYDESSVVALSKYEVRAYGETVNEVTLTYTDPATRLPTTIVAQDLAAIDSQGSRIPVPLDLQGIQNHDVARAVIGRELAQRTMPLVKLSFEVNRNAWHLGFGDLFKFSWVARSCVDKVFRVLRIEKGTLTDNIIRVEAIEDIYQHSLDVGLSNQEGEAPAEAEPETPEDDSTDEASVISTTTTAPPVTPSNGDRYMVPPGASGAWAGHTGELAEWDEDEGAWVFTEIPEGTIYYVGDDEETVQQIGGEPVPIGGGGGAIAVMDVDEPTAAIDPATTIAFDGAEVSTLSPEDDTALVRVSPLNTKGDLYTHDGSSMERLSVGTDGLILGADSTEATGLKWTTRGRFLEVVANGDEDNPEVVFSDGDVVFVETDVIPPP